MSKRLRKTGRQTLSVFLSATTTIWLMGGVALVPTAAQAAALTQGQIDSIVSLLQSFGADATTIANVKASLSGGTPSGGGGGSSGCGPFNVDLHLSSTGAGVKCLQQFLNGHSFPVATSGTGSAGNESTYFGAKTQAAVAKWQASAGITPSVGYFGPKSRAAVNAMAGGGTPPPPPGTTPPPGTPPPPPGTGSGLTVVAGTQPAATLAVQSAINVPFTVVKFTASNDGDVTVNSLTVERTGLMNDAALAGVIILDENGNRLGLQKTLNSNHQSVINTPFTVKAGQTRTITVAGDLASSLSSYSGQVGYLALNAIGTSAAVSGTPLPITGTGQTVNSTLSVGSITLSIGALDPNSNVTKNVGTTNYVYTALKATSGSAEDMVWKSVNFYQAGSAGPSDLANVVVKDSDGNVYPTTISSDGKYYMAMLGSGGILITKGSNKDVAIQGDIVSGSGRTVNFDLYRYEDAVFHGKTYGYDIKASGTSEQTSGTDDSQFHTTNPRWDGRQVTISKGSLDVQRSSKIASQNVAAGLSQAPMGAFDVEAKGEPITFTSWAITVTTTNGSGTHSATCCKELKNLTVYDENGKAVAGPKDVKAGTVTLTDSVTVPTGKHVYTVKANVDQNAVTDDTFVISFTPSTAISSVTGQTTNSSITPTPASSISGPTMTVKAGSLTVSPSLTATSTVALNASQVEVSRFTLDATASGDDLKVNTIQIRKHSNSGNTVSSLILKDGTTALVSGSNIPTVSSTKNETLTFTLDSPLVVTKGTTKTLSLYGNILSTATTGSVYTFDFGSGSPSWTVISASQGTSVTVNTTTGLTTNNGFGISIAASGGYYVLKDSSSPTEKWLAGYNASATGSGKNVPLAIFRFVATGESMNLTDLRLQLSTLGSSTGPGDMLRIGIYDDTGTLIKEKYGPAFNNGVEDFNFTQGSVVVPADSYKKLTVKADLAAPVNGVNGTIRSGTLVGVDYDAGAAPGAVGKQKAVGATSGTSVHSSTNVSCGTAAAWCASPNNVDTATAGIVYFRSVPTVALVPLSSNELTLTGGEQTLMRFTIKADPAYDVGINKLTFRIATTNNATFGTNGNFYVRVVEDNINLNTATGTNSAFMSSLKNYDGSNNLFLPIMLDKANRSTNITGSTYWYTVPQGQTRTFELKGTFTKTGTGNSISTTLLGDNARGNHLTLTGSGKKVMQAIGKIDPRQSYGTYGTIALWPNKSTANVASSSSFIWTDFSTDATTTHATTTSDWMNGFQVPGLTQTGLGPQTIAN